jgi:tetratricopeptide (TPR) repeat protein
MGRGRYGLHPALPAYLAARWRWEEPGDHDAARNAAITCLISAYATLGGRILSRIKDGDAGRAVGVVGIQRQNFGHFLGLALAAREWDLAHDIAQALNQYWNARGLLEEARDWVERVRQATEGPGGTPPGLDTAAGALWLFAVSSQASRQLQAYRLEEAEAMYRDLLAMLDAQPPSMHRQRHIARAYHNLGLAAQCRGRLDDAEAWYCRSLEVREELMGRPDIEIGGGRRNCPGMAMTHAALLLLREERQQLCAAM